MDFKAIIATALLIVKCSHFERRCWLMLAGGLCLTERGEEERRGEERRGCLRLEWGAANRSTVYTTWRNITHWENWYQ